MLCCLFFNRCIIADTYMEFAMIKRLIQIFMLALSLGFATLYIASCTTAVSDEETNEQTADDGRWLYGSSNGQSNTGTVTN